MSLDPTLQLILTLAGTAGLGALVYGVFKDKLTKQTIDNYKGLAESQEKTIVSQGDEIKEITKRMTALEEQVRVIKTIPLQQLAGDYHKIADAITQVVGLNEKMYKLLKERT